MPFDIWQLMGNEEKENNNKFQEFKDRVHSSKDALGRWCQTQRGNYKKGKLSKDRIQLLDHIGFSWNQLEVYWQNKYAELKKHKKLKIIKKDIRMISKKDINKIDCIMHLASIANDPAAELNAKLTWEVNVLATKKIMPT